MERFNRNEIAFLEYSVFVRTFFSFHFLECLSLSKALKLNPSIDTSFYSKEENPQLRTILLRSYST